MVLGEGSDTLRELDRVLLFGIQVRLGICVRYLCKSEFLGSLACAQTI